MGGWHGKATRHSIPPRAICPGQFSRGGRPYRANDAALSASFSVPEQADRIARIPARAPPRNTGPASSTIAQPESSSGRTVTRFHGSAGPWRSRFRSRWRTVEATPNSIPSDLARRQISLDPLAAPAQHGRTSSITWPAIGPFAMCVALVRQAPACVQPRPASASVAMWDARSSREHQLAQRLLRSGGVAFS